MSTVQLFPIKGYELRIEGQEPIRFLEVESWQGMTLLNSSSNQKLIVDVQLGLSTSISTAFGLPIDCAVVKASPDLHEHLAKAGLSGTQSAPNSESTP